MIVTEVFDSPGLPNFPKKSPPNSQVPDEEAFGSVKGKFKISEAFRKGITAYPLDRGNFELPIPGETVPVIIYGDTHYYLNRKISHGGQFSYSPQLAGLAETDKIEVQKKLLLYKSSTNLKKQPLSGKGSKQINSRFGSSIIFDNNRTFQSGNPTKPTLRLSNHQSQLTAGTFYSPELAKEGSTILLTSGDSVEDFGIQLPLLGVGVGQYPHPSEKDTIVIDTDRLILQTQDGSVFMNSSDDFIINGRNVYINQQPVVLGSSLNKILVEPLLKLLLHFVDATKTSISKPDRMTIKRDLEKLLERQNDYLALEGNHPLKKKPREERSRSADLYVDEPENPGTSEKRRKVATIYSLKGDITVNGSHPKSKQKLKEGDVIQTKFNPASTIVWKWSIDSSEYKLPMGKTITIQDPTEFPGGVEDITPPGKKVYITRKVANDVLVNGRIPKLGDPVRVGDKIHLGPMGFLGLINIKTKQAAKFSGSNRDVSGSTGGTARTGQFNFIIAEEGVVVQVFERKLDRNNYRIEVPVGVASVKG
jgi:hypothetical protein